MILHNFGRPGKQGVSVAVKPLFFFHKLRKSYVALLSALLVRVD